MPKQSPLHTLILSLMVCLLAAGCAPSAPWPADAPAAPPAETSPVTQPQGGDPQQPQESPTPAPTADPQSWVWTVNEAEMTVLRVNPASNQVDGVVELNGVPALVAAGEGSVWALEQGWQERSHVVRMDPSRPDVIGRFPVAQGSAVSLAVGRGVVWVGVAEPLTGTRAPDEPDYSLPGGLLRLDAATGQEMGYSRRYSVPMQILIEDPFLWTLEWFSVHTQLQRVDLTNGQLITLPSAVDSPAAVHQFARMARSPLGLWALSMDPRSRFVYELDPLTGRMVRLLPVGAQENDNPLDLLAVDGSLWVVLRSGKLVQLDAARGDIQRTVQIRDGMESVQYAAGALWLENRTEAELYRVNVQSGQLEAVISTGPKPPATPTPLPRERPGPTCKPAKPTRLQVGGRAVVKDEPPLPNRVRSEPSLGSKIIGEIAPGDGMVLLEGPVCAGNWLWWKVQADGSGLVGWTAEGDDQDYWLVPVKQP